MYKLHLPVYQTSISCMHFLRLEFTPCKDEHLLLSMEKKKHKKIKAYRKSVYEEPTVKRCMLILDLKPFRSLVKEKAENSRA